MCITIVLPQNIPDEYFYSQSGILNQPPGTGLCVKEFGSPTCCDLCSVSSHAMGCSNHSTDAYPSLSSCNCCGRPSVTQSVQWGMHGNPTLGLHQVFCYQSDLFPSKRSPLEMESSFITEITEQRVSFLELACCAGGDNLRPNAVSGFTVCVHDGFLLQFGLPVCCSHHG